MGGYTIEADSEHPALKIYLIDCSESMSYPFPGKIDPRKSKHTFSSKMELLQDTFQQEWSQMTQRCGARDGMFRPRYEVAIGAFHSGVNDLTGGIKRITDFTGDYPTFPTPQNRTYTKEAFEWAERLLRRALDGSARKKCPAPMVCHFTDGMFNPREQDPEEVIQRIMRLKNDDGNVLVSHIYCGEALCVEPITSIEKWPGIFSEDQLSSWYAKKLFHVASVIPDTLLDMIKTEIGFSNLQRGARFLFPAEHPGIVKHVFKAARVTKLAGAKG